MDILIAKLITTLADTYTIQEYNEYRESSTGEPMMNDHELPLWTHAAAVERQRMKSLRESTMKTRSVAGPPAQQGGSNDNTTQPQQAGGPTDGIRTIYG